MWTVRQAGEGQVIAPDERLAWPAMLGLGGQHVLAMFGSTAIVPVLIDFPVSTTLLFSGIGTLLFVLITRNRVPSYTGSSFAFIAPVIAAQGRRRHGGRARRHPLRGRRARADRPDHRPRRLSRDRVPAAAGRDRRDRRADRPQPRARGQGPVLPAGGDRALHARRDPARDRRRCAACRRSSPSSSASPPATSSPRSSARSTGPASTPPTGSASRTSRRPPSTATRSC